MNRYPVWKYAILVVALIVGILYTLPNFFGEAPAVQVSSGKATLKVDASLATQRRADPGQGRAQAGLRPVRRQFGQGPLWRPRCAAQGQGRPRRGAEPGSERSELHRRPQPAVALAEVADGDPRLADVSGSGSARRRALPDAGRHEGGADEKGRRAHRRHPHPAARQGHPPRRHQPRRRRRVDPLSRCGGPHRGAHVAARSASRPRLAGVRRRHRLQAHRHAETGCRQARAVRRDHPEHHDAAQPGQRARRRRAGDPAAGCRPRRRRVAGRAGHGQGQGHHRPHGHARDAHGRRQRRGALGRDRHRAGALRRRALRRAARRADRRQAPGRPHRREPDRCPTRLRREPSAGGRI